MSIILRSVLNILTYPVENQPFVMLQLKIIGKNTYLVSQIVRHCFPNLGFSFCFNKNCFTDAEKHCHCDVKGIYNRKFISKPLLYL